MTNYIFLPTSSGEYDTMHGFTLKSSTFEDGTQVNQIVDENGGGNPIVTGPDQEWVPSPDFGRYPFSERVALNGVLFYVR